MRWKVGDEVKHFDSSDVGVVLEVRPPFQGEIFYVVSWGPPRDWVGCEAESSLRSLLEKGE